MRVFARNKLFFKNKAIKPQSKFNAELVLLNLRHLPHREQDDSPLQWENRWPILEQELLRLNADIYGLQEVQYDHFDSHFRATMSKVGYAAYYKRRTGGMNDGCAVLVRKSKFDVVHYRIVEYYVGAGTSMDRDQIGQILRLKCKKTGQELIYANTHLLFNSSRGDIKIGQLAMLFANIQDISALDESPVSVDQNGASDSVQNHQEPLFSIPDFGGAIGRRRGRGLASFRLVHPGSALSEDNFTLRRSSSSTLYRMEIAFQLLLASEYMVRKPCNLEKNEEPRRVLKTSPCPVIINGDFNIEPLSYVYTYVSESSVFLRGLPRNELSGQGERGGPCVKAENILPRATNVGRDSMFIDRNAPRIVPADYFTHPLRLASVYHHFRDDGKKEVSTYHKEVGNPDFIFYSIEKKMMMDSVTQVYELPELRLLRRLGLPDHETLRNTLGPWPNPYVPSDHIPLVADFVLSKSKQK
ncbi:hypothetical protein Y032_0248g95 [Ancylostoma ceylanicum]|uniref:Endonuclease/exonuclease/phosphatase domain-containing protein n=1 Tax=Ancylostoma ceylanicum TaxID=53326 RepID=A0A016SCL8_9BILA|nr:hypothetical protein Y032_0248g95 [Ancylostoma ceylanicum]